jgi:hypothetical protein
MRALGCAIRIYQQSFTLEIGPDSTALYARITTSLKDSIATEFDRQYDDILPHVLLPNCLPSFPEEDELELVSSTNSYRNLMHDVSVGRQVAYQVDVRFKEASAPADTLQLAHVPPCVRQIIDLHSGSGGVLSGDIPPASTAQGFQITIDLEPGTRLINVRQHRLTPLERDAFVTKVEEFIHRGWIEPSVLPWCSPVLFVPKPNRTLRFCVDFRYLNGVTIKDQGPLPNISELLDSMGGAKLFTALDLCSGFYQIPFNPTSRPVTAFSSPFGHYQWCVMPMGFSNSPAVFQRAMNSVLRNHILSGYPCESMCRSLIVSSVATKAGKR